MPERERPELSVHIKIRKDREQDSIKAMEPDLEPEPGADHKRTSSAFE